MNRRKETDIRRIKPRGGLIKGGKERWNTHISSPSAFIPFTGLMNRRVGRVGVLYTWLKAGMPSGPSGEDNRKSYLYGSISIAVSVSYPFPFPACFFWRFWRCETPDS